MNSLITWIKDRYTKLPLWVTNLLAPLFYLLPVKVRYGKTFTKQLKLLSDMEFMNSDQVEASVSQQFKMIIEHAYNNVPYYKKLCDDENIDPSNIRDIKDISKIPFLNKDILYHNKENLIASNFKKSDLIYITTSGTTGNPVGFYVDKDSTMKEWAYTNHIWSRVGYKPDSSRLVLRGKTFWAQKVQDKNWQYDALKKELSVNIFDMNEKNLEDYCLAIEKYKPEFIHGYMSATYVLSKYIAQRKTKLKHQFKAILAVSENVVDEQKVYVESILNCRVFSFYGHSERLAIAGECEYSSEYHVEPSYGYVEIIDKHGNQITNDEVGELVATGFCNKGMPLIRYKTGDMASWSTNSKCVCGRPHLRLRGVHGRWKQDLFVNIDRALVSTTAINMHSNVFDNIIRYQFYQDTVGEVLLKVVPNENYTEKDDKEIIRQLTEKTQSKIKYTIRRVNEIKVMDNGKYQLVDQQLKLENF